MTNLDLRKQIQTELKAAGFYQGKIDGDFGPLTYDAFNRLDIASDVVESDPSVRRVKASSFADPADVAAFRRCKAIGGSDNTCFKKGDNGIGVWGDDTTKEVPMCALPREDWAGVENPRGKKVKVTIMPTSTRAERAVICELRDTMPARRFITNGAGIDLNFEACEQLGLRPPVLVTVTWQWA